MATCALREFEQWRIFDEETPYMSNGRRSGRLLSMLWHNVANGRGWAMEQLCTARSSPAIALRLRNALMPGCLRLEETRC
jgi:hypothetical protein